MNVLLYGIGCVFSNGRCLPMDLGQWNLGLLFSVCISCETSDSHTCAPPSLMAQHCDYWATVQVDSILLSNSSFLNIAHHGIHWTNH